MNLYLITRWGNNEEPDGPDGTDTMFLVRAPDYLSAVSVVEPVLQQMPHDRVLPYANVCVHLGTEEGTSSESRILLGPIIQTYLSGEYPIRWLHHDPDDPDCEWMRFDEWMRLYEQE